MEGYWKATSITGEVYGLFKVEEAGGGYRAYRYRDGEWKRDDDVLAKFGWDDDYTDITEAEAMKIKKMMDKK